MTDEQLQDHLTDTGQITYAANYRSLKMEWERRLRLQDQANWETLRRDDLKRWKKEQDHLEQTHKDDLKIRKSENRRGWLMLILTFIAAAAAWAAVFFKSP